jgi:peptide deformylase
MIVMPLIKDDIAHFTKPCEEFDFEGFLDASQLARDLVDTMYHNGGLGLAANQVGLPYRVFCFRGDPANFVCFNPVIIQTGVEEIELEEGCLSFPGLIVNIKRPKNVRVRFWGPDREQHFHDWSGLTARIVLHEMDHLNGKLFYNRVTKYHRDKAFKNRGKLQ